MSPAGFDATVLDGASTATAEDMYDAFAAGFGFPEWFGRNMDALEDFLTDLNGRYLSGGGKTPRGHVLNIDAADRFLEGEPRLFCQLLQVFRTCAASYLDESSNNSASDAESYIFAVVLTSPAVRLKILVKRVLNCGLTENDYVLLN